MTEESNDIPEAIAGLAETIKAIQEELKAWKSRATNNGIKLQAWSKHAVTDSDSPLPVHMTVRDRPVDCRGQPQGSSPIGRTPCS